MRFSWQVRLSFLLLSGAGCTSSTGIDVTVRSSSPLSALSITVSIDQPSRSVARALPIDDSTSIVSRFSVALPDANEQVALSFDATSATGERLSRMLTQRVEPHHWISMTVDLSAPLEGDSDGSIADAGGADAGGADAGGADGSAPACPSSAIFCDDFESGGLSGWSIRTTSGSGNSVAAQGTVGAVAPYRGNFMLHAQSNPTANSRAVAQRSFSTVASGTFGLRAYVNAPTALSDTTGVFLLQDSATGTYLTVEQENGTIAVSRNNDSSGGYYWFTSAPASLPANHWSCLEVVVDLGSSGRVQLFLDGVSLIDSTHDTTGGPSGGWDTLWAGISAHGTAASASEDVMLDDLVVAQQRVGCE